ncbi:hypothetical protein HS141_14535 [Cetobacterium somerae]|nr:hypothetical protein [Cetobacterium somerae]MCQ9628135.1 hypothetical protein [Cetobacterium somerae]
MEQYNDEQRKIDLLEWFLENNFFNKRIVVLSQVFKHNFINYATCF